MRRIRPEDAGAIRDLRLRALAHDPLAFGSTLDRERACPPTHWTELAHRGATARDEGIWIAEGSDGAWIGMVGGFPRDGAIIVWGMWVDPSQRGTGLGGRLIDALLGWVDGGDRAHEVRLTVNPTQGAAVALYESRGFVFTGEVEPLGHTPGIDIHGMRRARPKGR